MKLLPDIEATGDVRVMRDAYGTRFGVIASFCYPGAVSPHRTQYFRGLIGDWQDDPITDAALVLLPEWVRWNGERPAFPALLIDRAVSAAPASPDQPA